MIEPNLPEDWTPPLPGLSLMPDCTCPRSRGTYIYGMMWLHDDGCPRCCKWCMSTCACADHAGLNYMFPLDSI